MPKTTKDASAPPLSVLLSHTLIALTAEFDQPDSASHPSPSLALWSNLLRVVGDEGVPQRDIPKLARVSKRVARIATTKAERGGWVTVDSKPRAVRPTPQGRNAREAGRSKLAAIETGWRKRFGNERIERLRATLQTLVAHLDIELPHYPTGYGQGDASPTGGPWVPGQAGPPRIPAHGQEWPVVLRGEGDTVSTLPLSALVSQAFSAFTIDYEAEGFGRLATAANALRFFGDEPMPLADAPAEAEVTGTGRSTLERHGVVVVEPDPSNSRAKLVHLTSRGRQMRDAYEPLLAEVEGHWRTQYGDDLVRSLRGSLEPLVGELDTASFPHHPPVIAWLAR